MDEEVTAYYKQQFRATAVERRSYRLVYCMPLSQDQLQTEHGHKCNPFMVDLYGLSVKLLFYFF